jgi:ribonuclease D
MFYFGPATLTKEYFMQQLVDSPPPVVAVDCETISLDERMPIGFSIATTPDESFYFQTFPEPDPALHYLSKVLTDPTIKKVFHNAPFDLRNLPLVVPIESSNIADTAVMARLLGAQHYTYWQ